MIVESPAKAKTIARFLGKDYEVLSSYGHIRDLSKKNFGIDIAHGFKPDYVISEGKERVVADLRKAVAKSEVVWLASDEDREGEAIAWHLSEVLKLSEKPTHRIVFHEITQGAIERALEAPRSIDQHLVDAQQARRILDRLVGFEISPILWRKVRPSLSAGRVQSVAVRLIVDREREIIHYCEQRYYRVTADFKSAEGQFKAELNHRFQTQQEADEYVTNCTSASFSVVKLEDKPATRTPAPPFTTSTLQQEASRKLGMASARTMAVAQRLYEAGMITYMRTDSVNLSQQALGDLKKQVEEQYGAAYHKARNYKTKTKGAQEAHEAIRPTSAARVSVEGMGKDEQRLYELIRKRALASQMADAQLLKTTVEIADGKTGYRFIAQGESLKFDGFLRLYTEGNDEDTDSESVLLPRLSEGDRVELEQMVAQEKYTQHPPRYSEAALVKRLDELGIGRPSTYAPTITTIVDRGYVVRDGREGVERTVWRIVLKGGKVTRGEVKEKTGVERKKLYPSDIGIIVTDFLLEHFPHMMEYGFTADVEEEFDSIATGELSWREMLTKFYGPFHAKVDEALKEKDYVASDRVLGVDPATGGEISVRIGRYGPLAQLAIPGEDKPRYAGLRKGQLIETITLEEALELFKLPRKVGSFEGSELVIGIGKFGPYVRHNGKYASLGKEDDPYTIDEARAIALVEAKRASDAARVLRTFAENSEITIVKGRWGAYIEAKKKAVKIPKGLDWEAASYSQIKAVVDAASEGDKEKSRPTKRGGRAAKK